ncbi:hypothetical protein [Spirochaeta isovalerica]|uniref:Uncharacterized protein n=1 Tax=Spirochaeta isovalerica TaxID=150 RepID=A0A841R7D0_9SPIO|nr:hypothetical protein [Spirochaeta isovalerica]MBB6479736.1 hypothetical protein [Spirochaeta isovalerica]
MILLTAQSNETLDNYLNREKADFATTILLIYQAAGVLGDEATGQIAMEYLGETPIGKRYIEQDGDAPIEYRQYAHIVMDAMDLPGGLLYSITWLPRYAARELTYRRWMPGKPLPGAELTPWEVMTSLSQILAWTEDNR